jgi:WD40 repeat protein
MSVAFSSDGRTLATGGMDGDLRFWDAASREPRGEPIQAHLNAVISVAFSSDGRTLATGNIHGRLRFWFAKFPEGDMRSGSRDQKANR